MSLAKKVPLWTTAAVSASLASLFAGCAAGPRLVAEDPGGGFALYRSGRLSAAELETLCGLGVEEIVVLDGDGERECRLRATVCPGLRVRYDHAQDADRPVSADFLRVFDAWIEDARAEGRRVAFRCRHGWHRAGRLAAYYRIRFEGASAAAAAAEMQRVGRWMWRHPTLDPQVEAYADLVAGRRCSTDPAHRPLDEPDAGLSGERFDDDLCSSPSP